MLEPAQVSVKEEFRKTEFEHLPLAMAVGCQAARDASDAPEWFGSKLDR
jgi:hypothetical protein